MMARMKSARGQFWSFDVIFAIIIFGVAITILAYTWYNVNNQLALSYGNGATIMQLQAESVAQTIMSPGVPSDWQGIVNTSNPSTWGNVSIGLMGSSGSSSISTSKLYTFMSMASTNYGDTKELLGVAYNYYIIIQSQGAGSNINVTIGVNPQSSKSLTTYVYKRLAFMNGVPVMVYIEVWTNTPLAVS